MLTAFTCICLIQSSSETDVSVFDIDEDIREDYSSPVLYVHLVFIFLIYSSKCLSFGGNVLPTMVN